MKIVKTLCGFALLLAIVAGVNAGISLKDGRQLIRATGIDATEDLKLNDYKITGLGEPVATNDAATKIYVDTATNLTLTTAKSYTDTTINTATNTTLTAAKSYTDTTVTTATNTTLTAAKSYTDTTVATATNTTLDTAKVYADTACTNKLDDGDTLTIGLYGPYASVTNQLINRAQVYDLFADLSVLDLYGSLTAHPVIAGASSLITAHETATAVTNVLGAGTNLIGSFIYTNPVEVIKQGNYEGVFAAEKTVGNSTVQGYIELFYSDDNGATTNIIDTSNLSGEIGGAIAEYRVSAANDTAITNSSLYVGVTYYLVRAAQGAGATVVTYLGHPYHTRLETPGFGSSDEIDPVWTAERDAGFTVGGDIFPNGSNTLSLGSFITPYLNTFLGATGSTYYGANRIWSSNGVLIASDTVSSGQILRQGSPVEATVANFGDTLYVTNSNVGVGTNIPRESLHIQKDEATIWEAIRLQNTHHQDTTNAGISLDFQIDEDNDFKRCRIVCFSEYNYGDDMALAFFTPEDRFHQQPQTAPEERMRINNHGHVGIGTTTPSTNLHVVGSQKLSGQLLMQGGKIDDQTGRLNLDDTLYVTNSNVGIGTASPGTHLEVSGSTPQYIRITNTSTNDSVLQFRTDSESDNRWCWAGYDDSLDVFKFVTGLSWGASVNGLIIDLNGKVGIGTSSPEAKLHVNGTANIDDTLYVTNGMVGIGTNPPSTTFEVESSSSTMMRLAANISGTGGAAISFDKVTPSPADGDTVGRLIFNHSITDTTLQEMAEILVITEDVTTGTEDSRMMFQIQDDGDSKTVLTLDNPGYVGINDTTPSYGLDVNGTMRVTGKATFSGGTDPKYVHYEITTLPEIVEFAKRDIPPSKLGGIMTFFANINGTKAQYGYIPNSGQVYNIVAGTMVTNITPITTNDLYSTYVNRYQVNPEVGLTTNEIIASTWQWRVKDGYTLNEHTGIFYDSQTNVVPYTNAVEHVQVHYAF